jgi:membrane fusion protein
MDFARPDAADKQPALFRSEALVAQQTPWVGTVLLAPRMSHRLFAIFAACAAVAIVSLLAFADYTRKARISGWLMPQGGMVKVYAPRSGVVLGIHVTEGAQVRKGEVLFTLSDELQSASLGATQAQISKQLAERRRSLMSERERQQMLLEQQQKALSDRVAALRAEQDQIERELELLTTRVSIAERAEALQRNLHKQGFISEQRLQMAQAERLEQRAKLGALSRSRLVIVRERVMLEGELRDLPLKAQKEIANLERTIAQLEQDRAEAEARREIVVPAPSDGTVTAIQAVAGANANTTVPLLAIVPPYARLEAHLYSPSRAVGFVRPGQRVLLRYQAYPYQKFGHHEGEVYSVAGSAVSPAELPPQLASLTSVTGLQLGPTEPVYRITVNLATQSISAYGERIALQPGMLVEADVLLEKRRLYEWILDPLYTLTGKLQG